jgi:hypothetical protein
MADIQTSTWSETAANNNASPPNGAPEGWTGAQVNDVVREIMAALKREWNRSHPTVIAGGTADALTLTYATAPPAYASGLRFAFYAGAASNTGAATLNVNSLGVKNITRRDGSTALSAADITANAVYEVVYDGTSFRLMQTGIA